MKPTLFERKIIHACIQSDKYKIKRYFRLKKERKRTLGCKSEVTRKQAGLVVCVTAIFVEKNISLPYDFERQYFISEACVFRTHWAPLKQRIMRFLVNSKF